MRITVRRVIALAAAGLVALAGVAFAAQSGQSDEDPSSALWGCDAPPGSAVPLIGPNGTDLPGVFPCFDYQTMADLLDAKGITWRYYAPANPPPTNSTSSAYEAIRHIFRVASSLDSMVVGEPQILGQVKEAYATARAVGAVRAQLDQLLTRAMLLEEVWNYKFVPTTNLVDVHMGRLRHKVDGPGEVTMIHNVRGAGFVLRTGP